MTDCRRGLAPCPETVVLTDRELTTWSILANCTRQPAKRCSMKPKSMPAAR